MIRYTAYTTEIVAVTEPIVTRRRRRVEHGLKREKEGKEKCWRKQEVLAGFAHEKAGIVLVSIYN